MNEKNKTSKKNDVKEVSSVRKKDELEKLVFAESVRKMMYPKEKFKLIVHEHLFDNMVTLFKNEGYDMSFINTPEGKNLKSEANKVAKQIEEGGEFEEGSLFDTLLNSFISYLEMDENFEEFVVFFNEQPVDLKMVIFFSKYVLCMRSNYNERQGFIEFLCAKGQELEKKGKMIAYERVANYLTLLVLDNPSVEYYRRLENIVDGYIKKMGF